MTEHASDNNEARLKLASGDHVALRLEYGSAAHLAEDWRRRLAGGFAFVRTEQPLGVGAPLRLKLGFPGLLAPIVLAGVVAKVTRDKSGQGCEVRLDFGGEAERDRVGDIVARAAAGDPELVGRHVRLLVVEDNPHVSQLVTEGLREAARRDFGGRVSFEVELAGDGLEALQLARAGHFDAVITDVYLPNMDGPQLLRELRAHGPHLPVLAMSAGGPTAQAEALAAGCDLFLAKPLRLADLIVAMRSLLGL
jgi:CheY-like chemotaxis protein